MALKEVLQANKVPLPADFDERLKLVMMGLRRDPKFDEELKKFKQQEGGAETDTPVPPPIKYDSEDWLGPQVRWFLDTLTTPFARIMLRGLFMVVFFISYLEKLPAFGNILGAALDLMVAGAKIVTKTIQRTLPPMVGLIPLPYANLFGMMLAGLFGAIVWPLVAMISFSRQDFAVAVESFMRAIPPPFGDTIADIFMDGNRMVAKIDSRRRKLADDIIVALGTVANVVEDVYTRVDSGVQKVQGNIQEVKDMKSNISDLTTKIKQASLPPAVGQGRRKRLSTRRRSSSKWMKTQRTKSVKR